ncbi:MAG: acetyl-CoA C-acyltransferase [Hydrogenibacillus schlegelii]|uniref:Acetoacetyl-CoA thiolase n=1 Tax=Hydrogenibacillus schlegelii TaxID=1484 RepID=A0A947CWV6_HYDSH|nr:acetyl-CoA C-acyltransferase [Hydrogenibacillus schlegelii]
MQEAVIVDGIRTPFGRYGGALARVRPDDLAAHVIAELVKRHPEIPPEAYDDVYFGCANQAGEDGRNVARMAVLLSGLPVEVPGATVNRLCGSGMEAVIQAAAGIQTGRGEIFIAGGVESMSRAPLVLLKPEEPFARGHRPLEDTTLGWRFTNPRLAAVYPPITLGETAENVAEMDGITREDQDRFALESQRKYQAAKAQGFYKEEIVPVPAPGPKGETMIVEEDEHPRPNVTLEALARLKPAFREGGTVTAGNSTGLNDGAAALLLMSRDKAAALGLRPRARIIAAATAGVHPSIMGLGPVPASRKALKNAGLTVDDMDVVEINEAFAAQVIASARRLGVPDEKLNPNGGAIAIGHPLGASGARLVLTLMRELERRGGRFGLAAMCIGIGQGIAVVLERLA